MKFHMVKRYYECDHYLVLLESDGFVYAALRRHKFNVFQRLKGHLLNTLQIF